MAVQNSIEDPDYISFLFSSKFKPDCFFLVGNKNHVEPERIGVAKAMLMAHSTVMRVELEDSKLAGEDVPLLDIYPDTFRNLLRYVYGHDTTAALCFDEADNLFYVAEKYMMGTLKKKLATKLMSLLNTENICSLLNNPACYMDLELDCAITKILRYETHKVLASPLFPELNPDGFIKILEQDGLSVPEIELWRSMVKWAKHNAHSEDGKDLRNQVAKLTKHIRICSVDSVQLREEVMPTNILTHEEMSLVCISVVTQEKQSTLTEFCNEVTPRGLIKPEINQFQLYFYKLSSVRNGRTGSFTVTTKKSDIELLPLECLALSPPYMTPAGATYVVSCTTTITRITDYLNDTSTETPTVLSFSEPVKFKELFLIPLTSGGHNVILQANSKYIFKVEFYEDIPFYFSTNNDYSDSFYENDHLMLKIKQRVELNKRLYFDLPMKCLKYKPVVK